MSSSKNFQNNIKKTNYPSLRIIHPEQVIEKMSFSQYDEQPTIILLASNRDSLNSVNNRPNSKGHSLQKLQSRLLTYQSNLMQSSPQRSDSSAVDGEFVCKYLTPIKKQQFQKLLFKDEINQNIPNIKTKPTKPLKNQKNSKIFWPNDQNLQKRSITRQTHKNSMYSKMVTSFLPSGLIDETVQPTQTQIRQKNETTFKIKQISPTTKIPSAPTIFIDPHVQVRFLKLNNNQLFKKLQVQIEQNKNFERKMDEILGENKILSQKNLLQQNLISHLKQTIIKLEEEKRKFLAKQWEEFELVKNILIQKRKSKSKDSKNRNLIPESSKLDLKTNLLTKFQKQIFRIESIKQQEPKISCIQQKQSLMRQNGDSFGADFLSWKISQSNNCNTIQSQNNKKDKNLVKKERKMSFENNKQLRRYLSKEKERSQLERILQDKLFINKQNRCKKYVQQSSSRKTSRKNGSALSKIMNLD